MDGEDQRRVRHQQSVPGLREGSRPCGQPKSEPAAKGGPDGQNPVSESNGRLSVQFWTRCGRCSFCHRLYLG